MAHLSNNNHLIADGLYAASAILAAKGSSYAKWMLAAGGAVSFCQAVWGETKLSNRSNSTVFCKAPNSCKIVKCPPHSAIYSIDAFAVNGKVYKISNGSHMSVSEKGEVYIDSVSSALIQLANGFELKSPPDKSYKALFNLARRFGDAAIGMAKPMRRHQLIQSHLCKFIDGCLSCLNEPLLTSTYMIEVNQEVNLDTNGSGKAPDVLLGRFYFDIKGKEQPPMPYIIIEVEKKQKLKSAKNTAKEYLKKFPNISSLEVFVLEYESHTWYKINRDGTETNTSYCERLNVNLDDGLDWTLLDLFSGREDE